MHVPLSEMLKSIPGAVGIRLEDELPYSLIRKEGELELRHYDEFTLARTRGRGSFKEATDSAFKKLANFIFGKNASNVTSAMTTPVFVDKEDDGWTMSFYLLPEAKWLMPLDSAVKIETHPAKDVAVLRYSGNQTQDAMEAAKEKLLELVKANGLNPVSDVWWAQYDQPMSLPITKRNEALVKIEF